MRTIIIGLGSQGQKHLEVAKEDVIASVDPINEEALYSDIRGIPLDLYDAAIVVTPNQEKLAIIMYLLENQKHVMVEKPLIGKAEELEILKEEQQKRNVTLYTAYNYRFEPHIIKLKELIDNNTLGEIYTCRIFLGNGTAINVLESPWRDKGRGVLEEISSHQLDLIHYLFDDESIAWIDFSGCVLASNFENKAYDHIILHSPDEKLITIESTYCYWKNTFTIDITGKLGSAHLDGLLKWGFSELTIRERIFPSGVPKEQVFVSTEKDPTLELQYEYFKELCKTGGTNIDTDIWINNIFNEV